VLDLSGELCYTVLQGGSPPKRSALKRGRQNCNGTIIVGITSNLYRAILASLESRASKVRRDGTKSPDFTSNMFEQVKQSKSKGNQSSD